MKPLAYTMPAEAIVVQVMTTVAKVLPMRHRLLVVLFLLLVPKSYGFDFKHDLVYGIFTGFGSSGVEETKTKDDGSPLVVSRSESPGMLGVSVEAFINQRWNLAFSHRRGIKLGPISSKVGFTGIIARRYFLRAPLFVPSTKLKNSVSFSGWVPFVGIGAGLASGTIDRQEDAVERVTGSGFYMGGHFGVDYRLNSSYILRPEVFYSITFLDDSASPSALKEVGFGLGFHFRF